MQENGDGTLGKLQGFYDGYYPIAFLDPTKRSSIALFDIGTNKNRLDALNRTVAGGNGSTTVASIPVALVDDMIDWRNVGVVHSKAV
jgi:hypothetical protein